MNPSEITLATATTPATVPAHALATPVDRCLRVDTLSFNSVESLLDFTGPNESMFIDTKTANRGEAKHLIELPTRARLVLERVFFRFEKWQAIVKHGKRVRNRIRTLYDRFEWRANQLLTVSLPSFVDPINGTLVASHTHWFYPNQLESFLKLVIPYFREEYLQDMPDVTDQFIADIFVFRATPDGGCSVEVSF
jgi:hypothetical protein